MWRTKTGQWYKVNIGQQSILDWQKRGARFCFMDNNIGIYDKTNEQWYSKPQKDSNESGDDAESEMVLKDNVTAVCADGEEITGYIIHYVYGSVASAPDIERWFIIVPGDRPYLSDKKDKKDNNDIIITDL